MFFLIFESIGMAEMILIFIVALIVFGPRKLPEIGRMIGKTMADLRRVSGEFRQTWEREVEMETLEREMKDLTSTFSENPAFPNPNGNNGTASYDIEKPEPQQNTINAPEVKTISVEEFSSNNILPNETPTETQKEAVEAAAVETSGKRDWL